MEQFEFKGTKGDWYYSECTHQMDDINTTIHGFSGFSGHVFTTAETYGETPDIARKYNAQLIAHAPQMFEMLNRIYVDINQRGVLNNVGLNEIEKILKSATNI